MTTQISTITPEKLHAAQQRGEQPALLDVRTAAEYRAGHIPGAQLLPVGELGPDEVTRQFKHAAPGHQETLYITCKGGERARQAAERLQLAGFTKLALVEGGTQGWEQSGLPVRRCGNAISLERQVQIAVGSLLILKVVLGFSVHTLFFALAAVIGAGLIVAGVTRWCGMAQLIARMPWNRSVNYPGQAKA
ncbi:MAG: rhodanese-like domain-containing protein [Gammaproteobacteria bacterium]